MRWWSPMQFLSRLRHVSRRSRAGRGRAGGAGSSRRSQRASRAPHRPRDRAGRRLCLAARPELARGEGPLTPRRRHPHHLDAENSYAEAVLAPLSSLRVKLVEEMKGRIEPDDSVSRCPTVPTPGANTSPVPSTRASCGRRAAAGRSRSCSTDPRWRPANPISRSADPQPGPPSCAYWSTRPAPRLRPAHPRSRRRARAGGHFRGPHLHLGARRPHAVLRPARRRASRALRLPPPGGQRPEHDQLVYEEKDLGFEFSVDTTRGGRFVVISTEDSDSPRHG